VRAAIKKIALTWAASTISLVTSPMKQIRAGYLYSEIKFEKMAPCSYLEKKRFNDGRRNLTTSATDENVINTKIKEVF